MSETCALATDPWVVVQTIRECTPFPFNVSEVLPVSVFALVGACVPADGVRPLVGPWTCPVDVDVFRNVL